MIGDRVVLSKQSSLNYTIANLLVIFLHDLKRARTYLGFLFVRTNKTWCPPEQLTANLAPNFSVWVFMRALPAPRPLVTFPVQTFLMPGLFLRNLPTSQVTDKDLCPLVSKHSLPEAKKTTSPLKSFDLKFIRTKG